MNRVPRKPRRTEQRRRRALRMPPHQHLRRATQPPPGLWSTPSAAPPDVPAPAHETPRSETATDTPRTQRGSCCSRYQPSGPGRPAVSSAVETLPVWGCAAEARPSGNRKKRNSTALRLDIALVPSPSPGHPAAAPRPRAPAGASEACAGARLARRTLSRGLVSERIPWACVAAGTKCPGCTPSRRRCVRRPAGECDCVCAGGSRRGPCPRRSPSRRLALGRVAVSRHSTRSALHEAPAESLVEDEASLTSLEADAQESGDELFVVVDCRVAAGRTRRQGHGI